MQLEKHTHTVYIELDGGRQAGMHGCRKGARKDGGWEGGSKGRVGREGASGASGGSEGAMTCGRVGAGEDEGREG